MGQPVDVVVADLRAASARLVDTAQQLQDGLASVNDETTQLLGSGWKGGAASAYAPVWEQWNGGATKVVEGLQRMSELLNIAASEYAKTDQSAAEGLGATMQGSGGSPGGGAGDGADGASTSSAGTGTTGASSPSSGSASGGDGLGQAMSSVGQLGGAAVQPLTQASQAIAGLAQQVAQVATQLAQDTEMKPDDEKPEGAAASDEQTAGVAPVEDALPPGHDAQGGAARPLGEES